MNKLLNKILLCGQLARFHSPIGYILVFFPACFGLMLASNSVEELTLLPLLFLGSIICRGAGCVINDIFDQDIDKQVARTRNRPLANGSLDNKTAFIFLLCLAIISFAILLTLTRVAILVGCFGVILIVIYPLMKRITNFAQIFLGITFNLGALIGYAAVRNTISASAYCMYLACVFWTIGYDTIYAFMDIRDDKRIKVKSTAIILENNYKLWLYCCYGVFISLFTIANYLASKQVNIILLVIVVILLYSQIYSLKIESQENCLHRFKANFLVGVMLSLSMSI